MRRIHKHREPECLASTRRQAQTAGAMTKDVWSTLPTGCKEEMRHALAEEQHGLCAYCTRRIDSSRGARDDEPRRGGMRVEHWVPRSTNPGLTFTWSNLLGVCGGIVVSSVGDPEYTCDKARGDRPLRLHPAEQDFSTMLRYTASGEIRATDERARHDVEVLGLNASTLQANRAEVWRRQGGRLRQDDSIGTLRRMLRAAQTPGPDGLPPYAPVIECYATRKLRKRGVKP